MLNGKELMLGDYVNIAEYDYPEVVGIVKEILADGEEMIVSVDNDRLTLDDEHIHELFLSKTFFLENGFVDLETGRDITRLYNRDNQLRVNIFPGNCFRCQVNRIEMNYVHEFQHLLRLIGLSDYANNLKI